MSNPIEINEYEIKHILKKHKLINESISLKSFVTKDVSAKTQNFKSFVEFLNGNMDLDVIADNIQKFNSDDSEKTKSTDDDEETTDIEVGSKNRSDDEFYKDVLEKIGAEPTSENMKFFYAWRQAEGAKATYNPFNTTHKKEGSTLWNCLSKKNGKCVSGVRNYDSEEDGISATAATIKNGYYPCILNGLRNSIGAKKIATNCLSNLKTWGTGGLIKTVLSGSKLNPPPISRTLVKKV